MAWRRQGGFPRLDPLRLQDVYKRQGDDWVLAPHVAYALGRLSLKGGRVEEAKKWYGAMAESAKDTALRKQALEALLRLPEPDPKYALALLEIAPFHREALSKIRKDPGPEDPRTAFPLGYASFFSGDLEEALAQLGRVPREAPCFERAAFFRARALSNLGRADEALPVWKELSLGGSRYSQPSIELISRMAREKGGEALEALVEISDIAQGDPAASALAELAGDVYKRQMWSCWISICIRRKSSMMELAVESSFKRRNAWAKAWNSVDFFRAAARAWAES